MASPTPTTPTFIGVPLPSRPEAVVFLAGVNLMVVQVAAIRELATLVGANELVILITTIGSLLGMSLGALFARRINGAALLALALATTAFHLTLPFLPRWGAAMLATSGRAGLIPWLGASLGVLALTPFHALLLPQAAEEAKSTNRRPTPLVRLYVIEVLGGLAALAVAGLLPAARMDTLLALNLVAMLAILTLLFPRVTVLRPALVILPAAYLLVWDPLHRASLEVFYRDIHGLTEPHVVASEYSRYQRVDLIRTGRETHLYLNGNLLYGTRALHVHNLMVATAPAWLAGGGRPAVLLVAGGSLDNVRSLAPHTSSLDVVEIDETVVRLAREHIQDPRRGFPTTPWRLTIDDGRVFLADSPAPRYDLITLDLAVPTFAQSAQLYSPRFFALARQNLRAGGLLAVALGGKLDDVTTVRTEGGGSLPNRIVAGLSRTFAHVMVVRTGSRDYAWASDQPLRINSRDLQGRIDLHLEQLPEGRIIYGRPQITVLAEADVRAAGQSAAPVGDIDVRLALELSWRKLQSRLRDLTAKN